MPLFSDSDWERLARHFAGDGSAAERAETERWIEADPARQVAARELESAWSVVAPVRQQWDGEAMWSTLQRQLHAAPPLTRQPVRAPARRLASARSPWTGVVAFAVVLTLVVGGWAMLHRPASSPVAMREYATRAGQRVALTLPDGSSAVLGPESRLVYRTSAETGRDVEVRGEAYFTVTPDPSRPFQVRAGNMTARVLGTAFAVRAYDPRVPRVVVTEGKVAVQPSAGRQHVVLLAGDIARIDDAMHLYVTRDTTVGAFVRWTVGELRFEDVPLRDLRLDVERWYGVRIHVTDPALLDQPITITLDSASGDRAFTALATILGATAARHGDVVTFTRTIR